MVPSLSLPMSPHINLGEPLSLFYPFATLFLSCPLKQQSLDSSPVPESSLERDTDAPTCSEEGKAFYQELGDLNADLHLGGNCYAISD